MNIKKEHIVLVGTTMSVMTIAFFLFLYFTKPAERPLPPDFQPKPLIEMQGTVERYGINPEGNIDKIFLHSDSVEQWIHFPPHTANLVLSIAKIKANVLATFQQRDKGPNGKMPAYELHTISGSNKIVDVTDIPPPPPAAGQLIEVSGRKIDYERDENGNVNAFILSGKLIMLPPHTRESLLPLLISAKTITVKGVQRDKNSGFVNENAMDVVQPDIVIIDSVNYLIR